MSQSSTGVTTPASIVEALKAIGGNPPKIRASFAGGRCVRGTYIPSDQAWAVHSFLATNPKGERRFIKFQIAPVGGDVTQTADEVTPADVGIVTHDVHRRD